MSSNHTQRVYVTIEGGRVTNIDIPSIVDGTHTVIDCDEAEVDAASVWASFDDIDREYMRTVCADLMALYWPGEIVEAK